MVDMLFNFGQDFGEVLRFYGEDEDIGLGGEFGDVVCDGYVVILFEGFGFLGVDVVCVDCFGGDLGGLNHAVNYCVRHIACT